MKRDGDSLESNETKILKEAPDEDKAEMSKTRFMLGNLGKHSKKQVEKILKSQNLKFKQIKSAPKWNYCFVKFETEDDYKAAFEKLAGFNWNGNSLYTSTVKEMQIQERTEKVEDSNLTPEERIANQVTPEWKKPYPEQLQAKDYSVKKLMTRLKKEIFRYFPKKNYKGRPEQLKADDDPIARIKAMPSEMRALEQLNWVYDAMDSNNGHLCPVSTIVPSPNTEGYRNKCEFSFGRNLNGEKACGFLLGMYKEGCVTVLNPATCLNVPEKAKAIVNLLEKYIQESKLDVYNRETKLGFYRHALVRTLKSGETMLMLQVQESGLTADQVKEEQTKFVNFIKSNCPVESIYWQESDQMFNGIKEDMPMTLLDGSPFVTESLLGLKFQISPTSFFQINPEATENLYNRIRDLCLAASQKSPSSESNVVLLDLCCGTGTIGISMAPFVKKVIGVEMCAEAVQDAKENAKLNGITNVEYFNAKVEEVMHQIFKYHIDKNDTVIAVLDPPRSGVHYSVIKCIRDCPGLDHVIFVACDMSLSMQNFVDLCRPYSNKYQGYPFRPMQCDSFDLFPHTKHTEVVMELVRTKPSVVEIREPFSRKERDAMFEKKDQDAVVGEE